MDLDSVASESPPFSIAKKLKQNEVALCDLMDVGNDGDPSGVLIAHEKVEMGMKGKSKSGCNCMDQDLVKDASSSDPGNSARLALDSLDHVKNSTSGSINSNNINCSNLSCCDDDDEVNNNDYDSADDASDYDDNYEYLYEDDYLAIQSQFDNVDLPPGVEASLPWLKYPASSASTTCASALVIPDISESKKKVNVQDLNETSSLPESKSGVASTSSSTVPAEVSSNEDLKEDEENGIMLKFKNFKQFDTVEDCSDHHYNRMGFSGEQPPKNWAKRIQEEWKSLEKDLPDTIYVRVYEARMELLRAVIVGPSGTPYHDGLFVFDCLFPTTYPNAPPMVYYYSGGLRLNPNLYECGKVCLSLLGTWSGKQTEMWIPGQSTMLQVLVSIQALILNAKPFFNEPGYENSYRGVEGDRQSKKYNEDVFIMSLKTMMYTLRRPPKYFEDFVIGHFHTRAHDILMACKAYVNGSTVGSVIVKDEVANIDRANVGDASREFRETLRKMINFLVTTFSRFGSIDCEQFRING